MKRFTVLCFAICLAFASISYAQKKPVAKPFTTSGVYNGINLSSEESGDYYGINVYLTESDGQLYALVTTAEGGFSLPVLVEAKTSGKDMRTVEFTLPDEDNGDRKLKGTVSATSLTLNDYQGKKFVLKRGCDNLYSNIAVGSSGDYGGMEVYITDAGGPWYALVTVAEGVLMRPVLVEVNVAVKNGALGDFDFSLPGENGARKFKGQFTKTGITLTESGTRTVLKTKCYK